MEGYKQKNSLRTADRRPLAIGKYKHLSTVQHVGNITPSKPHKNYIVIGNGVLSISCTLGTPRVSNYPIHLAYSNL